MFQKQKNNVGFAGSGTPPWTDPAACHKASLEERVGLFENFQKSAFRLETLDQYIVADEVPQFQAYLIGDESKNTRNKE